MEQTTLPALLTSAQDSALRAKIARLRSQMFSLAEAEQEAAGAEIVRLKAIGARTWDADAQDHHSRRLERMGF